MADTQLKRSIITVLGKDAVGIIAKVCNYLASNNININDITQTTMQGYFNMMMLVDTSNSMKEHTELSDELASLGDEIGVQIKAQKEEIFQMMHRI